MFELNLQALLAAVAAAPSLSRISHTSARHVVGRWANAHAHPRS